MLILHGCQTLQFQNFVIPSTWLSHQTTSKYCYPCYSFLTQKFQILPTLYMEFFWIGNPTSFFFFFLKTGINYVSIITTIVINFTALISHNAIFVGYFMPMSHGVNKKTSRSASLTCQFSPGLFVVLQ